MFCTTYSEVNVLKYGYTTTSDNCYKGFDNKYEISWVLDVRYALQAWGIEF